MSGQVISAIVTAWLPLCVWELPRQVLDPRQKVVYDYCLKPLPFGVICGSEGGNRHGESGRTLGWRHKVEACGSSLPVPSSSQRSRKQGYPLRVRRWQGIGCWVLKREDNVESPPVELESWGGCGWSTAW
jgi:hypothetical protein